MNNSFSTFNKALEAALFALEQAKRPGGDSATRESWAAVAQAAALLAQAAK